MRIPQLSALALPLLFSACDWQDRAPSQMTSLAQSQPLGSEKSLAADIRLGLGSLEVGAERSPLVYSMDLEYDSARYRPDVHYDSALGGEEGRLSVNIETGRRRGIPRGRENTRLRLSLSDALPLKLNISAGVGESRLALSRFKLARLDLESGVGGARLSAYEPNLIRCDVIRIKSGVGGMDATGLGNLNFRSLEFEGGVGGANLDLSGEWKEDADISVQIGVGGVNLRMPREIGVRVEAERHFLSGLHLDEFTQRDSFYFSRNYDQAGIHVSVRVRTGIGGFRITWL